MFTRLIRTVLPFVPLALIGCTSPAEWVRNGFKVGPNYGKPPAPVAAQWIDANDKRVRSEQDDNPAWWCVFEDPVLNALVRGAYQQHLTLRVAGRRVLEAQAQRAIAAGFLFPQIQQAFADYNRNEISRAVRNQSFPPDRFFSIW